MLCQKSRNSLSYLARNEYSLVFYRVAGSACQNVGKLTVSQTLKITSFCSIFHCWLQLEWHLETLNIFIVKFVLRVIAGGKFHSHCHTPAFVSSEAVALLLHMGRSWNFSRRQSIMTRDRVILQSLHADIAFVVVGRRATVPWHCDLRWACYTFCWLQIGVEH